MNGADPKCINFSNNDNCRFILQYYYIEFETFQCRSAYKNSLLLFTYPRINIHFYVMRPGPTESVKNSVARNIRLAAIIHQ